MRLYEIVNQYQMILSETFDPETGEVNEQALSRLDDINTDIKEKSIAVASYIKNIDAERKAIEEAKKAMTERESRLDKRVTYLTNYLQFNMERCEMTEISCPYFVIKLKKCPVSVNIQDENSIPKEYIKEKMITSIDKLKIKNAINSGIHIPGASLKQNLTLQIR